MTLTFLYPIAAWLFALLPLVWWPMRRRPRWGHLALRVGVFACLIVALMQPSLVRRNAAGVQVFVLDQRASLGRDGQAAARAALARVVARAPAGARRVLIQLGGGSGASPVGTPHIVTDGSLSTALTRALDAIPLGTGGAVTLIASDRSTDGHWQDAVEALARRGIPLDTIALAPAPRPAFVGDVAVAPARVGEAIRLLATVEGDGGLHRLTVSSDGRVLTTSAPFRADGITRVALSVPADHAGFLPLRVMLDGGGLRYARRGAGPATPAVPRRATGGRGRAVAEPDRAWLRRRGPRSCRSRSGALAAGDAGRHPGCAVSRGGAAAADPCGGARRHRPVRIGRHGGLRCRRL
ncbi:hypothetical protein MOP88_12090 [Sphingomonas sp. WKB10]|nr:hypothetical protein [Sphingomonas sp. WKB10]